MRLRIITSNTFPEGAAATSRIHSYANALSERGIAVEVVTPTNNQPIKGKLFFASTTVNGIEATIIRNIRPPRSIWAKRILALLDPAIITCHTIFTARRADVFLIYLNTAFTRWLTLLVLRLAGRKAIIELNEYPFSHDGGKLTELSSLNFLLRQFTFQFTFPLANGFITISKPLTELAAKHAPNAKLLKLPALLQALPSPASSTYKDSDEIYIIHAGSLSERKDGIACIFEAFAIAHKQLKKKFSRTLKLLLTSDAAIPATRQRIHEIISSHELKDHVIVTGHCNNEKLSSLLAGSLALIINKPNNLQNNCNFPTKLPQYLASGRPVIIAAKDMELNNFIAHGVNALVAEPNDSRSIAESIEFCFEFPEAASAIGRNASETAIRDFLYSSHACKLSKFVEDL